MGMSRATDHNDMQGRKHGMQNYPNLDGSDGSDDSGTNLLESCQISGTILL